MEEGGEMDNDPSDLEIVSEYHLGFVSLDCPYMVLYRYKWNNGTLQYTTVHYTTQHYTTLHNTTQYYTILQNTTQHYIHYTVVHYTGLGRHVWEATERA